jgi:hypothetical protein
MNNDPLQSIGNDLYEFGELNLKSQFNKDSSCDFVPYGNTYDDAENMGEVQFDSYVDALTQLGAAGWFVGAALVSGSIIQVLMQRRLTGRP